MKIRIKGNTLRLRLTTREWDTFRTQGKVEDCIRFDEQQSITYVLKASDEVDLISARFNSPFIMVLVPITVANYWIQGGEVGIRGTMPIPGNVPLEVLVEKDFKCLQSRQEDETVLFPHPDNLVK